MAGRDVDIDPARTPLRLDGNGLPMHGLLSAKPGWKVERQDSSEVVARFDFAAHPDLMATFPFGHELTLHARLDAERLTIATTVEATGDAPVPIAFGFHPYLRLPGIEREAWHVEIPVAERLLLDDTMLPTGERRPCRSSPVRSEPARSTTPTSRLSTARSCSRAAGRQDRAGVRERLSRTRRSSRRPTTP